MAITSETLRNLCTQEESNFPDNEWKQERHDWLCQAMDHGDLALAAVLFVGGERTPHHDRNQLVCEAIKFHELRLAGFSFDDAVLKVAGA